MARYAALCLVWLILLTCANPSLAGNFYSGITPATVPWPGGIVPYQFTNTLTQAEQQTFLNGLREWELAANVKFVPYTNQSRWILFGYDTNFLDYVSGGSYSPQLVMISSLSRAQVCHEMGHSFGFTHENIRPDATNYVLVLTNNISNEPTNIFYFTIDPTSVTNGNYDYESVMHLGWDFVSTDPGVLATQQPKPPNFPKYQYRMGNFCLSPGDRAALAYLYGPPAVPLSNVVTNTADAGLGSLRAALYYVTDHPGAVVTFNIPTSDPGYSNGVYNIHLTGMLPPLVSNGMVIDGSTQPGFAGKPLIVVDGSQILPETFTSDTGLLVYSSSNQVKSISFSGFVWNGLTFEYPYATNNTVAGCWLGIDATGTNPAPNAYQGILVTSGSSYNTFGGKTASARNVISGNSQYGIFITGTNTVGNVVEGNYIGTDPSGSIAVGNELSGVYIGGATSGNRVGGTNAAARNILSGNVQYGVWLSDTSTINNFIEGNYIGTDSAGSNAVPNGFSGMFIGGGASGNTIGGASPSARNVLSGNIGYGIFMNNAFANVIAENYIGVNASGETALGNTFTGIGMFGILASNYIGAGNVISGNPGYGIEMGGIGVVTNYIFGNSIGLDAAGTNGIGAQGTGIGVFGGTVGTIIGGTTAGMGNVISGNNGYGVDISDPGTSNNAVLGNLIGTDFTGTNALPNNYAGVTVQSGAVGNLIGGPAAGAGNIIAFNAYGVALYQTNAVNNAIRGNSIHDDYYGGIDLDGFPGNHTGYESGPDDWQNYPVITNAFGYGNRTIVQGSLNSLANQTYFIDFYYNNVAGPYGYGEGQVYLGAVTVTTTGSGNAFFAYTNTSGNYSGQYLSATATATTGDSSQFSLDLLATNEPAPSAQFTGPFYWAGNGFVFNLALTTNFSYHLQATTNLSANPVSWVNLTNFTATKVSLLFTDRMATSYPTRFYRVASP